MKGILRDCLLDIIAFVALMIFLIACLCTNWFWFDETPYWKQEKEVQSEQPLIKWPEQTVEMHEVQGGMLEFQIEIEEVLDNEQLMLLAKIIDAESGADWCTDELQLYVGSVVLNRVYSDSFPNTIEEVLLQKEQYGGETHWRDREPSVRTIRNAKQLLLKGSVLPSDVVYQANYRLGSGLYVELQGVYFCYE